MHDKKFDDSIKFVARHYRAGLFEPAAAWRRMGLGRPHWSVRRIAAAVAAGVVLTASACFFTFVYPSLDTGTPAAPEQTVTAPATDAAQVVRRIEFSDATVAQIADEIMHVYGVRIDNLPDTDTRLTLSYEGSATDLVATINTLLNCNITICDD